MQLRAQEDRWSAKRCLASSSSWQVFWRRSYLVLPPVTVCFIWEAISVLSPSTWRSLRRWSALKVAHASSTVISCEPTMKICRGALKAWMFGVVSCQSQKTASNLLSGKGCKIAEESILPRSSENRARCPFELLRRRSYLPEWRACPTAWCVLSPVTFEVYRSCELGCILFLVRFRMTDPTVPNKWPIMAEHKSWWAWSKANKGLMWIFKVIQI